jgi:hypothetical protein
VTVNERRTTRLQRTVHVGGEYVLSVELPPDATLLDVSAATVELARLARFTEGFCEGCGVPHGYVHHPDCPLAPDGMVETLRAEAPVRTWTWTLRSIAADELITQLHVPAGEGVYWNPNPETTPRGLVRWWVDRYDGSGEQEYGLPFSYWPKAS